MISPVAKCLPLVRPMGARNAAVRRATSPLAGRLDHLLGPHHFWLPSDVHAVRLWTMRISARTTAGLLPYFLGPHTRDHRVLAYLLTYLMMQKEVSLLSRHRLCSGLRECSSLRSRASMSATRLLVLVLRGRRWQDGRLNLADCIAVNFVFG
jgi:hypothetical protein